MDILEVLVQVSIQRLKDLLLHTSIVLKTVEAATAACCTPGNDAHCAMFARRFEMTRPLFATHSRLVVLGFDFGLLGLTTGLLFEVDIGINECSRDVYKYHLYTSLLFSHATCRCEAVRETSGCPWLTSSFDDNGELSYLIVEKET